jgi:hypothetical protein
MIPSINCYIITNLTTLIDVNNLLRVVIEPESGLSQIIGLVIRACNIDDEIYKAEMSNPWLVNQVRPSIPFHPTTSADT